MEAMQPPLLIKQTRNTPGVILDPEQNVFEFSGRSLPEHAVSFYRPIISWLSDFKKGASSSITFKFDLEYFNTPSAKPILQILKLVDDLAGKGFQPRMLWLHREDDIEMKEVGEEFAQFIKTPLELVEY